MQKCKEWREEQLMDNFSDSHEGFNENREEFFTLFKFLLCEFYFFNAGGLKFDKELNAICSEI